jgi:superoxide dismutase, Fe-Mn family
MIKYNAALVLALSLTFFSSNPIQCISPQDIVMEKVDSQRTTFELPPLPFGYDALEPYIDSKTVNIHYNRHHKTYVDNLNKAIKGTQWEKKSLPELFSIASSLPPAIRNNAGGHWNHSFYWASLCAANDKQPIPKNLEKELIDRFGSIDNFKEEFTKAGLTRFGSGSAWLVRTPRGTLEICSTANQDNPLMDSADVKGKPLLCCDVWEHAYYLKYLNRRDSYMESFWKLVDWQRVSELADQKEV